MKRVGPPIIDPWLSIPCPITENFIRLRLLAKKNITIISANKIIIILYFLNIRKKVTIVY